MDVSDPDGVTMETEPIFVRAGPQRVSAAFIRRTEGPVDDLMSPHDWSLVDRQIGVTGYGITALAHLKDPCGARTAQPYRGLRDAEPAEDLQLPADVTRGGARVRR